MEIKLKLFLFFILFFILGFIYLFTPQIISDTIYGILFGSLKFIYMDKNKNVISFTFNHKNYDGNLMAYSIEHNLVKYKIEKDTNIYNFEKYQYLNNNRILHFSRFTSSISYLLKEIIENADREIKVCIVVSIRDKIKDYQSKGNFLKLAYFTIIPSDNIYDICSKVQTSVKNTQSKNYLNNNTTCHDFVSSFYNVDYIFDSWRSLSSIYTKNDGLLIRKSTNKISEKDILNLKDISNLKNKKSFINLDFFDNKYIISGIINF